MLRRLLRRPAPPVPAPGPPSSGWPHPTTTPEDRAIVERCLPFTMTGPERLQACVDAVRYLVRRELPGDLVECGVWRGGSVLAMLLTLQELGVGDRDVHLYDTFAGMTRPTAADVSPIDPPALAAWEEAQAAGERAYAGLFGPEVYDLESVRATVLGTGYPAERVHFVQGPVEETLTRHVPATIALLRLDTDWYESTKAEMAHLYPRLVTGGVLIVDDWGHWVGARQAVEEHFAAHGAPLLMNPIDYTGRIAVKA